MNKTNQLDSMGMIAAKASTRSAKVSKILLLIK